jgi:integrase family protein
MSNAVYLTHGTGAVAYRQVDSMKRANRGAGIPLRAHHTAKQPIKTKAEYDAFINYFYGKGQFRNLLLFVLGIEFGMLRSCDLLKLKIADVFTGSRCRSIIYGVIEQKTGKRQNIYVTDVAREAIEWYLTEHRQYKSLNEPLFISRKGNQLSTRQARDILHKAGEAVNSECPVAMHTLRKTWGYHTLKNHKNDNMALIDVMRCYNHSNPEVTLRYIGCSEEHKRDICMSFHITDDVKAAEKNETVVVDEAKKPADTTKRDDRRKHQHTSPLSSNMMDVLAGAMKQGLPFNVMNMRI